MTENTFYPIGNSGVPWSDKEKQQWFNQTVKSRSYLQQVVSELTALNADFTLTQYGELTINPTQYPLYALTSLNWDNSKPIILITGGVHGYETSGVHGAIAFLKEQAKNYEGRCNIAVLPCISPWGYEHILRWNPYAVDPNRSFVENSISEEAAKAMQFVASLDGEIALHIDLHETTDSDESEFRPALAARDGDDYIPGSIPDGFYLVGDSENKQVAFQTAIIESVKKVTHIAPADSKGEIIGSKQEGEGIINYAVKSLRLCAGMTNAPYTTTTEVYPDSEKATSEECNKAQVCAVTAAIDYILA
ncbi:M14 family metallocarboxypeptidase [Psychromonas sp. GE-S-Ul-11]|uniref:M14 family metallopeptidase n=1 Tax=Psychromonas sp. GE-S-Ul-11 TaxID=3241170 RepID=UPI00390CB5C4